MARSDYDTVTAPRSVISKIEQYQAKNGYPSKSQALGGLVSDAEKTSKLRQALMSIAEMLRYLLTELKALGASLSDGLTNLLRAIIDTIASLITVS